MTPEQRAAPPCAPPADEERRPGTGQTASSRDRDDARADRELAAAHLARAYRDDLTGALSRRPGRDGLAREISRARQDHAPLTVAFVDVDGLKLVNDRDGHASGDRVLQAVAAALLGNLRPYDLVVRYGGDEFVCVLVDTSREDAERSMTRVRQQLVRGGRGGISLGYAELREDDTLDRLVARADGDMYETRRRDRAVRRADRDDEAGTRLTCVPCEQAMGVAETVSLSGRPSRVATCPTCGHEVRLVAPDRLADSSVARAVITLPDGP